MCRYVEGKRYDRKVLDDCRKSMNNDGVIDVQEAKEIVADVLDGRGCTLVQYIA